MAGTTKPELYVGAITAATILADKIAPRLLDRYLARTGFDSQQTDEPEQPRPDNLFSPVPGDSGAHGPFDSRATSRDPSRLLLRRRRAIALGGLFGAAIATGAAVSLSGARGRR